MSSTAKKQSKQSVKKLWSTGQISRLVGINVKSVAAWIDQGVLHGVKLPNTPERRVHRDELRRFLSAYDYAWALKEMDEEEGAGPTAGARAEGGTEKSRVPR